MLTNLAKMKPKNTREKFDKALVRAVIGQFGKDGTCTRKFFLAF